MEDPKKYHLQYDYNSGLCSEIRYEQIGQLILPKMTANDNTDGERYKYDEKIKQQYSPTRQITEVGPVGENVGFAYGIHIGSVGCISR